jgi:FkbM family methyltransferase
MLSSVVIGQMEQKTLKLYAGARTTKPEGFFTIAVDERISSDVMADACNLRDIWPESCEEVIANGVLEHIEWPHAFSTFADLVRVLKIGGTLKISVPDIASFAQHKVEKHRFGYTASMLCELLQILGCGNFDWMSPQRIEDSSGAWTSRWKNNNVAEILSLSCRKIGLPLVPSEEMFKRLCQEPFEELLGIAASVKQEQCPLPGGPFAPLHDQRILFELLKTGQRIKFLEEQLISKQSIQEVTAPREFKFLEEIRARLINVESKLNVELGIDPGPFRGHRDQAFGYISYSQHGEDFVFVQLFNRLGIARPSYLDIGAHHPVEISNTALLYSRGARGVNIEANPALIKEFERLRPDETNVNVGIAPEAGKMAFYMVNERSGRNTLDKAAMEAFVANHPQFSIERIIDVEVITINDAVNRYCSGSWPDLLSIDIEGLDFEVLKTADFSNSKPKILCVEILTGPEEDLCATAALRRMLREKGFVPYHIAHGNAIFLSEDAKGALKFFD